MKKILQIAALISAFLLALGGCAIPDNDVESSGDTTGETEVTVIYLYVDGSRLSVTLAKNAAVDGLLERLRQGEITYIAKDYGGFEKVGSLGFSLPTNNEQIRGSAGDVLLYQGNQLVILYESNTWSYTRIGKIDDDELRATIGEGDRQITIRLN